MLGEIIEKGYKVGIANPEWEEGQAQTITFIVTEDCNLRCKYCYVTHKSKGKVMRLETAKKFIDYLLTSKDIYRSDAIILDFIGGEPLLETSLIDEICDYFKIRAFEEKSSWYWRYRINVSTNGVNYDDEKVQNFIEKNKGKLSIGITIDGTKEKHDLQRVFPDGSGSYDIIHKNIPLWLTQFPGSTKVTFASDDLIYLKDSIIHLWNEGITDVAANVVYENVWKENDDLIFEEQLKELADYIIDNELYNKYTCSLFLEFVGLPYEKEDLEMTSCGAGKMLALAPDGNIYPCVRYYDHSLNHRKGYIIGNVEDGIDFEKARVFLAVKYKYQSDQECINCPVARGCEFCQGFSYDEADSATNFQRAKYICKMHKARVRANNYYFAKLHHKKGIKRNGYFWKNSLNFLLDDNYMSTCSYRQGIVGKRRMSEAVIIEGLKFAETNFMRPVFIHSTLPAEEELKEYEQYEILHRIPVQLYSKELPFCDYQLVVECETLKYLDKVPDQTNIIFNIDQNEINKLGRAVEKILDRSERVNINIQNLDTAFDKDEYFRQLEYCVEILKNGYEETGRLKEINVITDLLFINEHEACDAGANSYTLGPDGNFYICPAFYSEGMESIGNLEEGISICNKQLYTKEYMPLCQKCDTYQCENCKYLNLKYTKEVNISPSFQCMKAQVERKASFKLQNELNEYRLFPFKLEDKEVQDPIRLLYDREQSVGYYKL